MATRAAKSEWFLGTAHDDFIEAARRFRQEESRKLQLAKEKALAPKSQSSLAQKTSRLRVQEVIKQTKVLLEDNYDELFDAFMELDANSNGVLTKLELREGLRTVGVLPNTTDADLDAVFEAIDTNQDGVVTLDEFLVGFAADTRKSKQAGKQVARRAPGHTFREVLIAAKDDSGLEQQLAVPVGISWPELLQKLQAKFERPVTFMYEAGGHRLTVKSSDDLKACWDSIDEQRRRDSDSGDTAHLEAFVVDFLGKDDSSRAPVGRATLGERRRVADAGAHGTAGRGPQGSLDFGGRHKWIDDMMRALGAPLEGEPSSMQGKWDRLLLECRQLDPAQDGAVTVEGFRNALTRTEPRMSADQVEWFVKDADKTEAGDVQYRAYAAAKKAGQRLVDDRAGAGEVAVRQAEGKIAAALRAQFKSLQQAFKRMDSDRDGRLSRAEFARGIEARLKLRLSPKLIDEVVRRADAAGPPPPPPPLVLSGHAASLTPY
jgi:Ca2+-binding EF-hand superfamily protein